jgi:predicted nucleotidyltransferase
MPVLPADAARTLLARARKLRHAEAEERERCLSEAKGALVELRGQGLVERAWVIGSVAWGGFGAHSDIDVVIEAGEVDDALLAQRIEEEIGSRTGRNVDILFLRALPEGFRRRVLAEGHLVA